jgi:hypothetical protein
VLLADDARIEDARGRGERVDRRIDPSSAICRERFVDASRCANVVAGAGRCSRRRARRLACTDVIDPLVVEVIRSCSSPISVASVGW